MPDEDKNFGASLKILESNNVTWKRSISLLDPHGLDYVSANVSRLLTRHCVLSTLSVQHWGGENSIRSWVVHWRVGFLENLLEFPQVRDWFLIHKPLRLPLRGSVISLNESHICHKLWKPSDRSKSSTWACWRESLPPVIFLLNCSPHEFWRVLSSSGMVYR